MRMCNASRLSPETVSLLRWKGARLWRGRVPHDWFWGYDRGDRDCKLFQRELEACITSDGFEMEFVGVLDPTT